MKARRLPGVRCSTLNTECRSLLCLMIMPGRSWVAGIAIADEISLGLDGLVGRRKAGDFVVATHGDRTAYFIRSWDGLGNEGCTMDYDVNGQPHPVLVPAIAPVG